jgi:hypothetical protein
MSGSGSRGVRLRMTPAPTDAEQEEDEDEDENQDENEDGNEDADDDEEHGDLKVSTPGKADARDFKASPQGKSQAL